MPKFTKKAIRVDYYSNTSLIIVKKSTVFFKNIEFLQNFRLFFFVFFSFCHLSSVSQQKKQYEIYFDSGSEILTTNAKNTLDSLFLKIDIKKISSINIFGYCDSIGKADYNDKLSVKRANNVKKYIAGKGVAADSVFIKGYGKTIQKYRTNTWEKNRRVSFEINYKKKPAKKNVTVDKPANKENNITDSTINDLSGFVKEAQVGDKMALKNLSFYGGTSELMPKSKETLQELLTTLKENPALEICIEGHICCASFDNDNLSGRRAFAVYNILVENGIYKRRLSYKGLGHTQPLNEEKTEKERQINRRVEIRIVKK